MRPIKQTLKCKQIQLAIWIIAIIVISAISYADTTSDIQAKINARNTDIQALEKEIAGFQTQINDLGIQANSLSATIKTLDLTQKKLQADIQVTENRIANKNLEIQELGKQIQGKEETIVDDNRIISYSLVLMEQTNEQSIPEILLSSNSISTAWNALDELGKVQGNLINRINDLRQTKANLETNKTATEKAKADLVKLNNQLKDQRQVVLNTQGEKNQLLKDTKQSEIKYKQILADKKAQKDAFEREVLEYESQLKLSIDTSKLPRTGSGVLSWPLDKVFITQYFGNTPFATANAQIYGGKGHNGIDLRASIGTPIKVSLSGTVVGMSNTDAIPGCYSYGKWIMVKHQNGLSTLYAHLSLQSVSIGQSVTTGQIIGYSGNTGYTTGPHLHYGVYATQGVEIRKLALSQSSHCTGAIIPVADFKAYLNPLSYL
ncbi:MAG: peptidoglycan DD-metalloendopeptidase family protein [Patescibacteria group bacterium]